MEFAKGLNKELTKEENDYIQELIARVVRNEDPDKINDWVSSLPDKIQVLLVDSLDIAIKKLEEIFQLSEKERKSFLNKLIGRK